MNKEKVVKKIGVLTLPLKGNYGGVLQAFALTTFLKKNGYNAILIDRQWDIQQSGISYLIKKAIYHHLLIKNVKYFCKKWINPKTKKIISQKQIKELNDFGFDAVVVGSDQVWRLEHTTGVGSNYFLDFLKNKKTKKISYAASFGKDSVDGDSDKLSEIASLLSEFSAISVREESGVKICAELFKVEVKQVLDPVLLLKRDDYLPIINKSYLKLDRTLTTYVLDASIANNKIIQSYN